MIGNDVVDLDDPETRSGAHHPRFDARVFCAAERRLLRTSAAVDRLRWILWAAKESAYKAARRVDPYTVFAPERFVVRPDDGGGTAEAADCRRFTVTTGDRRFHVRTSGGREHVHAVAVAADTGALAMCARVTSPACGVLDASVAARRFAIATLARVLHESPAALAIEREARMPVLWVRGRRSRVTLSLSHHGRYVAFAGAFSPPERAP
ncbi:MAG: 4-phosphopantetheinyl transferase family protein [Deltaproteobacteria bacterium]|nr:4-phosphopantetheinyl transferase family protein [Deltaproteobacteria bacterium]